MLPGLYFIYTVSMVVKRGTVWAKIFNNDFEDAGYVNTNTR